MRVSLNAMLCQTDHIEREWWIRVLNNLLHNLVNECLIHHPLSCYVSASSQSLSLIASRHTKSSVIYWHKRMQRQRCSNYILSETWAHEWTMIRLRRRVPSRHNVPELAPVAFALSPSASVSSTIFAWPWSLSSLCVRGGMRVRACESERRKIWRESFLFLSFFYDRTRSQCSLALPQFSRYNTMRSPIHAWPSNIGNNHSNLSCVSRNIPRQKTQSSALSRRDEPPVHI